MHLELLNMIMAVSLIGIRWLDVVSAWSPRRYCKGGKSFSQFKIFVAMNWLVFGGVGLLRGYSKILATLRGSAPNSTARLASL